ncbi:MAG: ABC transporter substrate-binding protein [Desulfobacteraceae bacterium]
MKTIYAVYTVTIAAFTLLLWIFPFSNAVASQDTVWIALNYPETGPYVAQGLDQWRAAELARIEINKAGGILGKQVQFRLYDSGSNVETTIKNVTDAIDDGGGENGFRRVVQCGGHCSREDLPGQKSAIFRYADLFYSHHWHRCPSLYVP